MYKCRQCVCDVTETFLWDCKNWEMEKESMEWNGMETFGLV